MKRNCMRLCSLFLCLVLFVGLVPFANAEDDLGLSCKSAILIEEKTGKPAGSDSANGKSTFASLYGIPACGEMVHRETERAKAALSVFSGAVFLSDLADYLADREK